MKPQLAARDAELVKGRVDSNHFHWLLETAFLSTILPMGEIKGRARQAILSKSSLGKSSLLKWG